MNVLVRPTELKLVSEGTALRITWSDGSAREYPIKALREACPCASCREKRLAATQKPPLLNILRPEETQPLRIQGMNPVGNYAYSIEFSDGHDTGIYTLDHLWELGQAV